MKDVFLSFLSSKNMNYTGRTACRKIRDINKSGVATGSVHLANSFQKPTTTVSVDQSLTEFGIPILFSLQFQSCDQLTFDDRMIVIHGKIVKISSEKNVSRYTSVPRKSVCNATI